MTAQQNAKEGGGSIRNTYRSSTKCQFRLLRRSSCRQTPSRGTSQPLRAGSVLRHTPPPRRNGAPRQGGFPWGTPQNGRTVVDSHRSPYSIPKRIPQGILNPTLQMGKLQLTGSRNLSKFTQKPRSFHSMQGLPDGEHSCPNGCLHTSSSQQEISELEVCIRIHKKITQALIPFHLGKNPQSFLWCPLNAVSQTG